MVLSIRLDSFVIEWRKSGEVSLPQEEHLIWSSRNFSAALRTVCFLPQEGHSSLWTISRARSMASTVLSLLVASFHNSPMVDWLVRLRSSMSLGASCQGQSGLIW